jgi:nicotinamidase-related amidase
VLKPRHSAFYGTPLEFLLEELGVERLVIAGIAIDMCVVATAQDAYVRKYAIAVPSDCSAGFSAAQEKEALSLMSRTMRADIRPSRD